MDLVRMIMEGSVAAALLLVIFLILQGRLRTKYELEQAERARDRAEGFVDTLLPAVDKLSAGLAGLTITVTAIHSALGDLSELVREGRRTDEGGPPDAHTR